MQPKTDTDTNTSEDPQSPEVPSVNVNGWPVAIVTPAAPAITAPGQTILSKQNSQLVVANNDGTTSLVVPYVQDSKWILTVPWLVKYQL